MSLAQSISQQIWVFGPKKDVTKKEVFQAMGLFICRHFPY